MAETLKDKIIRTLKESKEVKKSDIDKAIAFQEKEGLRIDRALIQCGLIPEDEIHSLLSKALKIPSIDLKDYKIEESLKEVVSEKLARQYRILPLCLVKDVLTIALSDPLNIFAVDDLRNITGKKIDVVMNTDSVIMQAVDSYYGVPEDSSLEQVSKDIDMDEFEIVSDQGEVGDEKMAEEGEQAPIIRMVNLVIKEAIRQKASDIHMEPTEENLRVRFRIDGALVDSFDIPKDNQNATIIRIKIISKIDITVSSVPQDGRFKMRFGDKEIDFRVSLLPTTHGQKIVMRVLDKKNLSVGLDNLGFSEKAIEKMQLAIDKPYGMILITGPTGSGKSTTLYSIINKLNTVDKNIITVEDPVEYLVEGLSQIQVNSEVGLTFASGLRSILRQSPDIVMVGEIRDNETADIAIKASLTGQLVLSTLHTNDAAGALTRLVDMGVESFLVASSLIMCTAQRLCRRLCVDCKEKVNVPDAKLKELNYKFKPKTVFYEAKGCDSCRNTGYSGRLGITEILLIDDEIREMLIKGRSSDEIKEFARKNKGMLTLWEDAMQRLEQGETTIPEALRVASGE